jgi:hypothetical protein
LDSLRRQLNTIKEDLHQRELEIDSIKRRLNTDEKQKSILDQQDQGRMRREIDTLERNYADLENQRKRDIESLKDELKQSNQFISRLQRERDEAVIREEAT